MSQSGETFLVFIKCPNLENLLSFSLEVVELPFERKGINLSLFHRRILKCRELIFSETDIVATPESFIKNQIKAVIPRVRFYSSEFQEKLKKMGLKISKTDDASPSVFQECLQYTSVAKLAPQWNIVQNLLVQGRDFLTTNDPIRALKLDIFVNHEEISLCVKPTCIKLPHFKIDRYLTIYGDFNNICNANEKCHILPSLKQGKVRSLSKSMPSTSMFKNYSDLKKHWKNMHGYRLPDIPEEDIWYVNISFNVPFSTVYTYPSICIRPFGMTEVFRTDPQLTLQPFIGDFCKKLNNICKEKCQIMDHKVSFPLLKLYPAADIPKESTPKIGTTYSKVQKIPYKNCIMSPINNGYQSKAMNGNKISSKDTQFQKQVKISQSDLNVCDKDLPRNATEMFGKSNQKGSFYANDKGSHNKECMTAYEKQQIQPQKSITISDRNGSSKSASENCNSIWSSTNNSSKSRIKMKLSGSSTSFTSESIKNMKPQIPFEKDASTINCDINASQKCEFRFFPKEFEQLKENLTITDLFRSTKMPKYAPKFSGVIPDSEEISANRIRIATQNFLTSKLNAKVSTAHRNHNSSKKNLASSQQMESLEDFEQKLMRNKTSCRKRLKKEIFQKTNKGKKKK